MKEYTMEEVEMFNAISKKKAELDAKLNALGREQKQKIGVADIPEIHEGITKKTAAIEVHRRLGIARIAAVGGIAGFFIEAVCFMFSKYVGNGAAFIFAAGMIFYLFHVVKDMKRLELNYDLNPAKRF